jgi:hypothetical protein
MTSPVTRLTAGMLPYGSVDWLPLFSLSVRRLGGLTRASRRPVRFGVYLGSPEHFLVPTKHNGVL